MNNVRHAPGARDKLQEKSLAKIEKAEPLDIRQQSGYRLT